LSTEKENLKKLFENEAGFVPDNANPMIAKAPRVLASYMEMRNKLIGEGSLSKKIKLLISISILVSSDVAGDGLVNYLRLAQKAGATEDEIIEAAGVAICISGGGRLESLSKVCEFFIKKN